MTAGFNSYFVTEEAILLADCALDVTLRKAPFAGLSRLAER